LINKPPRARHARLIFCEMEPLLHQRHGSQHLAAGPSSNARPVTAQTLVRVDGKRGPWCLLADTTASGIRVPGVLVDHGGNVSSTPFPDGRAQKRVYPFLPGHTESQAMAKLYERMSRTCVVGAGPAGLPRWLDPVCRRGEVRVDELPRCQVEGFGELEDLDVALPVLDRHRAAHVPLTR